MIRVPRILACPLCGWLLCSILLVGQAPHFISTVQLVRVDVQVVGQASGNIAGLKAEDFAVFDNDHPEPVRQVVVDSAALDLMLVLDVSGSMAFQLSALRSNAHLATEKLRSGDRIGVVTFSQKGKLVQPLSADFREVEEALRSKLTIHGGTDIYAGIREAAKAFGKTIHSWKDQAPPRRALLVITDNIAFMLRDDRKSTLDQVWRADAVLDALVVPVPRPNGLRMPTGRPAGVPPRPLGPRQCFGCRQSRPRT